MNVPGACTARPDYSGRWRFRAEASELQIPVPDLVALTIEHREPAFRLERTLAFGDRRDTFALDLTIGADPEPLVRGEATIWPSLRRDGDRLVFRTRIVRGGDESTNLVHYRLERDGAVLVAEESFRGPDGSYDNLWVFEREPLVSRSTPDPRKGR